MTNRLVSLAVRFPKTTLAVALGVTVWFGLQFPTLPGVITRDVPGLRTVDDVSVNGAELGVHPWLSDVAGERREGRRAAPGPVRPSAHGGPVHFGGRDHDGDPLPALV